MTARPLCTGVVAGLIMGVALAFGAFYVPHRGLGWGRPQLEVYVLFESAQGLRPGSRVEIHGLSAGQVVSLKLVQVPQLGFRVAARLAIDEPDRFAGGLTDLVRVELARNALLGEAVVQIAPASEGAPLISGALLEGYAPPSAEQLVLQATAILGRLQDFLDGAQPGDPSLRRTLLHLEDTLRSLRDFTEKLPR